MIRPKNLAPLGIRNLGAPATSQVADAFDNIAEIFDSTLENEITRRLRKKIYSILARYVNPGSTLLDINCGTGIDALHLSQAGYQVTGLDVSPNMIAAARAKLLTDGADQPQFIVSSYEDLSSLSFPPFDLVFSNFGGMNCTADLSATARSISIVTKPGGYFVGVLMPPFSIWEFFSFAVRFRWSDAFRRLRPHTPATGFRGESFPVHYHSPGSVARAFSHGFVLKKVIGLSIFAPTPQSTAFLKSHPRVCEILTHLDDVTETWPLLRSSGDHYVIVLQRRQ